MALDPVKNFAISRVATAPSPADSGTTLVVETGDGALFPDPSASGEYNVVIYPNGEQPTSTNAEIVRVTARTSDTMTIDREQEGTSARTIVEGDIVMLAITAKMVSDLSEAVTGVVTEDAEQTLTNKTLTAPALSSPTISGAWDGWISAGETWTYASSSTFTVNADVTGKYQINDKLKLTQTTVKHFRITAVSTYSGGNTTITVDGFGISTVANAAISNNFYSKMDNPQGFPQKEVLLFSGTPAASVTLSETSANFDRLDIWYEGNNDGGIMGVPYYYTKLDMTFPKIIAVAVDFGYIDSGYRIRTSGGMITASGTSLTITGSGANYSTDTTAGSTAVAFSDIQFVPKIRKVIGHRW